MRGIKNEHFADTVDCRGCTVTFNGSRMRDEDTDRVMHTRMTATYAVKGCWSNSVTVRWETGDAPYGAWSSGGVEKDADNVLVLRNLSWALADASTLVNRWRGNDIDKEFDRMRARANQVAST